MTYPELGPGFYPPTTIDETGPIIPPWYVRGWTAQQGPYLPVPSNPYSASFFPTAETFTVLNQPYFDGDGNPLGGYLTFWPSSGFTLTDPNNTNKTWVVPQRLLGTITWPGVDVGISPWAFSQEGSGHIFIYFGLCVVRLFNTDNPNLTTDNGLPLTYHVCEHFQGGRQYDITVPAATAYASGFYPELVVSGSVEPFPFDPVDPVGDVTGMQYTVAAPTPPPAANIQYIAAASTEYVAVNVTALNTQGSLPVNPTGDNVYFAFMQQGTPQNSDFHNAGWALGGPPYIAQILVGPANGVVLAQGKYTIWLKIVDNPEVPVIDVGTLYIT